MFSHGLGQQATFADAPRVFVLNVRNRESNPAAGGPQAAFGTYRVTFSKGDIGLHKRSRSCASADTSFVEDALLDAR
jgi:hypothetical protein